MLGYDTATSETETPSGELSCLVTVLRDSIPVPEFDFYKGEN